MSLPIPTKVPQCGFYYHYKHDPDSSVENYAYEVIGVGFHTEDDTRPGEEHFVIYRPLYKAAVYLVAQKFGVPCFDARPLLMWMGDVEKEGKIIPRFSLITNSDTIAELEVIKSKMYI